MDSKKKKKSGIGRLKAKRQSMMTAPSSQTRRGSTVFFFRTLKRFFNQKQKKTEIIDLFLSLSASTQFVVSSPAHGSQDESSFLFFLFQECFVFSLLINKKLVQLEPVTTQDSPLSGSFFQNFFFSGKISQHFSH